MKLISLPSGVELGIGDMPASLNFNLIRVLSAELKQVDIDLGSFKGFKDLSKLDINLIKNALFQLLSSEVVYETFFQIFARCTYGGKKITQETFNTDEAKADFFLVVWEVGAHMLLPFFKHLG